MNSTVLKMIIKTSITSLLTKPNRRGSIYQVLFGRQALVLAMILLLGQLTIMAQSWENLGPKNEAGCMTGLYLHSKDNKLFASSPDGGLWACDLNANPLSWTPISDYVDNLEITAFGVSPSNSKVIYLANKANSLYRTTNGGTSWKKLTSFDKGFGRVNRILVCNDPNYGILKNAKSYVYVGTTTGLFRSFSGGNSWTRLREGKGVEDVLDIAADIEDSRILFIGVRGKGVYKTFNRGGAWDQVLDCTRTRDTDNDYNPPRHKDSEMIKIALGEKNADGSYETPAHRTVAVKFGRQIFVNKSGGNFDPVEDDRSDPAITSNPAGNYRRTESLVSNEWCNAIAVDPFNPDHIIVGQSAMFNSTDGGDTWTKFDARHEDAQEIQFHRGVRDLVYLVNDGGVEFSTASTPAFSTMYTNLITAQLQRVGIRGDVAVGNSDHNGVIGTESLSGGQWKRAIPQKPAKPEEERERPEDALPECHYGGNGMEKMGVYSDPRRDGRFYILHDSHIARLIFPNAASDPCDKRATSFSNFVPYIVSTFPENAQQGIAVDTRILSQVILACADFIPEGCKGNCVYPPNTPFRLMLTRNGDSEPTGTFNPYDPSAVTNQPTWETTAESIDDPFVSVAFSPRRTGAAFAITRSGALHTATIPLFDTMKQTWNWTRQNGWVKAENGGTTRNRENGGGVRHLAVHPENDNRVYAITENTLAVTGNRGVTWTVRLRNIAVDKYYSLVARGNTVYLGTSNGVYATTNEGATWTKKAGNLPNVKVVQLVVEGDYLYAVTFGRGLWRIPLSEL